MRSRIVGLRRFERRPGLARVRIDRQQQELGRRHAEVGDTIDQCFGLVLGARIDLVRWLFRVLAGARRYEGEIDYMARDFIATVLDVSIEDVRINRVTIA